MTNERKDRVDEVAPAEPFDSALRWIIASDSNPHESYVVELHTPPGYSICSCMHFECRLKPILARGITPEEAVQQGLVVLKKGQRVENALKCKHICGPGSAEERLALATIRAFEHAKKTNTPPPRRKSA